jgi:hypothetical protein
MELSAGRLSLCLKLLPLPSALCLCCLLLCDGGFQNSVGLSKEIPAVIDDAYIATLWVATSPHNCHQCCLFFLFCTHPNPFSIYLVVEHVCFTSNCYFFSSNFNTNLQDICNILSDELLGFELLY